MNHPLKKMDYLERIDRIVEVMNGVRTFRNIQIRNANGEWNRCVGVGLSNLADNPENYRLEPEPVTRPWSKPSDIPGPVCYLRSIGYEEGFSLIIGARQDPSSPGLNGILLGGFRTVGTILGWHELRHHEYSTDRKKWHPCTVQEESK